MSGHLWWALHNILEALVRFPESVSQHIGGSGPPEAKKSVLVRKNYWGVHHEMFKGPKEILSDQVATHSEGILTLLPPTPA